MPGDPPAFANGSNHVYILQGLTIGHIIPLKQRHILTHLSINQSTHFLVQGTSHSMSSSIVHYNTAPGLSNPTSHVNQPPYSDGMLLAANGVAGGPVKASNSLHPPPTGTEKGDRDTDVPEFMLPEPLLSEEEAAAEFEGWKRAIGMPTVVFAQEGDANNQLSQRGRKRVGIEELLNPVIKRGAISIAELLNPAAHAG